MNDNDKSQAYKRKALDARARALSVGAPDHKSEWLEIAKAWDELAIECEAVRSRRDPERGSK